jgi:hypothetical protein
MGRTIAAVIASGLLLVSCSEQTAAHKSPSSPTPSAAVLGKTVILPPVEPGVINFKLTLQYFNADDGFDLVFDVPHTDQNQFPFCEPVDSPCVKGKTYGFQFRQVGTGKVQYAFRRQARFGTRNMRIEVIKSGTVDLASGGEFVVLWTGSPAWER